MNSINKRRMRNFKTTRAANLFRLAGFIPRRLKELSYVAFMRFRHFINGGYKHNDEMELVEFKVDLDALSPEKRREGVSGFYRVKNEERFLRASVEAHVPYLDEIVIVYNDCIDRTPEIARALEKEHPDKIKVFEYKPNVRTAWTKGHMVTLATSVHSLVNYYNYALSKTTRKIAVKIDADHIPVLPQFANAVEDIRKNGLKTMKYFFGVNIYKDEEKVFVNERLPFTHGLDCGFFPVSCRTRFVHRLNSESLALPLHMYFSRVSLGVLFYHLKGVKDDKGFGNLGPDRCNSITIGKAIESITTPSLVDWNTAKIQFSDMLSLISKPELNF